MAIYRFHLCRPDGIATSFEVCELADDKQLLGKAGQLLEEHMSCDYVEVWRGERPVLARYRFQPVIRPVALLEDHQPTA
jgi:hypothetical protein